MPRKKTISAPISADLDRQIDDLVKQGWFPSREYVVELALRRFLSTHQPEDLEKHVRQDVEKALGNSR